MFLLAITTIALFVCINPISSPRYIFGTVLLAFISMLGLLHTAAFQGHVPRISVRDGLALPDCRHVPPIPGPEREVHRPACINGQCDFDSFDQVINTIEYVQVHGIVWGRQLLGVVFFWVPRSFWPDKPIDKGSMLADWKMYSFRNLSAPIWSELYIDGGWAFLLIGMLILGIAIRPANIKSEATLTLLGVPGILGCILPFYSLIVLRSMLQSVALMTVVLVCYLFVRSGRNGAGSALRGSVGTAAGCHPLPMI
jgi:hypothetical protein